MNERPSVTTGNFVCVCVEKIVVDFISLRDMGGWELVIGVFHNHESERAGETERFDDEQM